MGYPFSGRFERDQKAGPSAKTVWKYGGDDASAEQQLKWPSGFVRLADGTAYISEAQGADIRMISADKKTLRVITSPAMEHPCTLVIVDQ